MTVMQISETTVHEEIISGPGAWRQADFTDDAQWIYRFKPETLREIETAVRQKDFRLPSFEQDAARIREELMNGRGFVLLRGIPVDNYSEEELDHIYWGIGALLGKPLPQNIKGDRLYSVRDEGYNISRDYGRSGVRFSKTTESLIFHTDSAPALMGNTPDVIGLFALQVAKSGGASALVSANSVHNVMLQERPDYLRRLYKILRFDRSAEWREGEPRTFLSPIFRFAAGLEARYFRLYITKGHERANEPLEPEDVAALEYFESVMARPELQVQFEMQRGDIQLINNVFVLHSRTAFEDWPERERKRHLKRLWIHCSSAEDKAGMVTHFIVHDKADTVGVAVVEDLRPGMDLTGWIMETNETISLHSLDAIPLGHKVALKDIKAGDTVLKYGHDIGRAIADIGKGRHVHTNNLKTKRW